MNIFTFVAHGGDLNEDRNFESFSAACLLLFQCLTGDGWSAIMDDCMINEERGCDPEAFPSDCGTPLALPYFISFTVIGSFVFLNLIVAVILDNFTALGNTNPNLVSPADIADFKDAWTQYDPEADGKMAASDLPKLVMDLPAPLGIANTTELRGSNPRKQALRFCLTLNLTQTDGIVGFKAVLDALIAKNYATKKVVVVSWGALEVTKNLLGSATQGGTPGSPGSPGTPGSPDAPLTAEQRGLASMFAEELIQRFVATKRAASPDGTMSFRHSRVPDRRRKKGAKGSGLKGVVRGAQNRPRRPRQSPRQAQEAAATAGASSESSTPALPRPHSMPPPPGAEGPWREVPSPTFPSRAELSERAAMKAATPSTAIGQGGRFHRSGPLSCVLWLVWMVLVAMGAFLLGTAVLRSLEGGHVQQWRWVTGAICALLGLILAPNTLGNALAHTAIRGVAVTSPQAHAAAASPQPPPPPGACMRRHCDGAIPRSPNREQLVVPLTAEAAPTSPPGEGERISASAGGPTLPTPSTSNGSPTRRKPQRPALPLDKVHAAHAVNPSNRASSRSTRFRGSKCVPGTLSVYCSDTDPGYTGCVTPSSRPSNRSPIQRIQSWRASSSSRLLSSERGKTALFDPATTDGTGARLVASPEAPELLFGAVLQARRKRENNEISDVEHSGMLSDMRKAFNIPVPLQSQRLQSQRSQRSRTTVV